MQKIDYFRRQLCHYAKLAADRGLFYGDSEFLSVRIPGTDIILVTPEKPGLETVAPEETLILSFKDASLAGSSHPNRPPDADFLGEAYLRRRSVFAIGHFHPPYATAYSSCEKNLPFVTRHSRTFLREILQVKCISCPSRFAGLCECFEGQRQSYAGVNVLLLKEDGIVTLGSNLEEVFLLADGVEQNARTAFLSSEIEDSLLQAAGNLQL